MRMMITIAALLLPSLAARAEQPQFSLKIGDTFEITRDLETSSQSDNGSSGSSSDHDAISVRVIAQRDGGVELLYDLQKGATVRDRASNWQFPALILNPANGPLQLLNTQELEVRVAKWLKKAKFPRSACGRWIFTWNAFRIECDPQSVLQTIAMFDLQPRDLRVGALYQDAEAAESAPLVRTTVGPDRSTFAAEMAVNPSVIRKGRAEADVAVAEISRKLLTFDDALRARMAENISGTISVTFDADQAGLVSRRTKVMKLAIKGPDGKSESRIATETLERRRVSSSNR